MDGRLTGERRDHTSALKGVDKASDGLPKAWEKAAVLLLLAMAALPLAYGIVAFGVDIPYDDEWGYVHFFKALENGSLKLSDLLKAQNEYRQLIPYIVYIGLGRISRWNLTWEMMLTLLMLGHLAWLWVDFLRKTGKVPSWALTALSCFFFTLLFSPSQHENWMLGMQFVYFFPLYCLTLCLLIADTRMAYGRRFLTISLISIASTFSSVNGIFCWMGMLPLLLETPYPNLRTKALAWVAWVSLIAASGALYLQGYQSPAHLTNLMQKGQPASVVVRFFILLTGNGFGNCRDVTATETYGWMTMAGWGLQCLTMALMYAKGASLKHMLPWFVLGLYGIGTAVLITIGRVNLGLMQACAPRYTGFTLFLNAAVMIAPVVAHFLHPENRMGKVLAWMAAAWMLVAVFQKWFNYERDYRQMKEFSARIAQAKAGLLISRQIPLSDNTNLLFPLRYTHTFIRNLNWINERGYLRPSLVEKRHLESHQITADAPVGRFMALSNRNDSVIATGVVDDSSLFPLRQAVVITCRNPSGQRKFVGIDNSGGREWKAVFTRRRLNQDERFFEAWLFDGESGKFRSIQGDHEISD